MRPDLKRVPQDYHRYISLVKEDQIMPALADNTAYMVELLNEIPSDKYEYRYAEGKWNLKEMLQHMIDTERIFCYRALCFARGEKASLPGFEENEYAKNSRSDKRNWNDLVEEFKVVRKASELLFHSFDDTALQAGGIANNHPNYVLAFGYSIPGHCYHHANVIRERYLSRVTG